MDTHARKTTASKKNVLIETEEITMLESDYILN